MPRLVIEHGQGANEGGGVVPALGWIEGERQVFPPMPPALFGEPDLPAGEGGKWIAYRFEAWPSGKLQVAFVSNTIDFVDLDILQAQCVPVSRPACPPLPGRCE